MRNKGKNEGNNTKIEIRERRKEKNDRKKRKQR